MSSKTKPPPRRKRQSPLVPKLRFPEFRGRGLGNAGRSMTLSNGHTSQEAPDIAIRFFWRVSDHRPISQSEICGLD